MHGGFSNPRNFLRGFTRESRDLMRAMRGRLSSFILIALSLAVPGSPQSAVPADRAIEDFRRVENTPIPSSQDAEVCVQSQTELLATRNEPRYLIQYRKGYCGVLLGIVSGQSSALETALTDLAESLREIPRNISGVDSIRLFAALAKLKQGELSGNAPPLVSEPEQVLQSVSCRESAVMSSTFCQNLADSLRSWIAWLALRQQDVTGAALAVQMMDSSPWKQWVKGVEAEKRGNRSLALDSYREALRLWRSAEPQASLATAQLMSPKPDLSLFSYAVARLELDLRQYEAAIPSLNAVIQANPRNSDAMFLRARAHDAMGQPQAALKDYAAAAELAQATQDTTWPLGVAFYRRGALLYKAGDFQGAQREFTMALESALGEVSRADVTTWRMMSAVAAGSCEADSGVLERTIPETSEAFPRRDAYGIVLDCRAKKAATLDQLRQLQSQFRGLVTDEKLASINSLIAAKYAEKGIEAEDRKERAAAIAAYQAAIAADPRVAKARFNLGSMYFEDQKYSLAEEQFRVVVETNAKDFEAKYWLAQSILQQQDPQRKPDACKLIHQSLLIESDELRQQFVRTLLAVGCPAR